MKRWKKIIIFFLVLFSLVTLVLGIITIDYLSGKKGIDEIVNLSAISYKLEIDDPLNAFEKIYNSPIWDTYYDHPQLVKIKSSIDFLDQGVSEHQNLSFLIPFLTGELSVFGIEVEGNHTLVYSANIGLKMHIMQATGLFALVTNFFSASVESKNYPGFGTIFFLDLAEPYADFAFTVHENYMFISEEPKALLKLLEHKGSSDAVEGYLSTWEKVEADGIFKCFINPANLYDINDDYDAVSRGIFETSDGMTMTMRANGLKILIDGIVNINDSLLMHHPLSAVLREQPQIADNFNLIPAGCAGFIHFNLGSFTRVYENSLIEISKQPKIYSKFLENKKFIERELHIDLKQDFASWIGHEVTIVTLTPRTFRSSAEKAIIIETRNKLLAMDAMDRVRQGLEDAYPIDFVARNHRGYNIYQIELPFFLNVFLGRIFDDMPKPFYSFIGEAFVATDERETLEFIIDSYLKEKTIHTDPSFNIVKSGDEKGNVFIYANTSKGIEIANELVSGEDITEWHYLKKYLQQTEAIYLQLTNKANGQLTVWGEIKIRERTREKMVAKWTTEIPADLSYSPVLIKNNNDVPDIYIFADNGYIYRFDLNGNQLPGSPVRIASKFFSDPVLTDVKGETRIFISTGNKIKSFNTDLKPHKTYRAKDIIGTTPTIDSDNGLIYFTDWSGGLYKYELESGKMVDKHSLHGLSKTSPAFLNTEKTILGSATAEGSLFILSDSGRINTIYNFDIREGISSNFTSVLWDDQDYFTFGTWAGIVHVLDNHGDERMTFPVTVTGLVEAEIGLYTTDNKTSIIVPTTSKLLYLIDEDGNYAPNWPVRAYGAIKTKPASYDINGDITPEIIALAEDGRLYAFTREGKLVRQWPIIASAMPTFYSDGDQRYMLVVDWNQKLTMWQLSETF